MDIQAVKSYVVPLLEERLPRTLYYHGGSRHHVEAMEVADRLAEAEGLSEQERCLVQTGGLLHDIGYLEQPNNNESIGARIAGEILPRFGYGPEDIRIIQGTILATKIPQEPQNVFDQIVCDADLDMLGREEFFYTTELLRMEWVVRGRPLSPRQWHERNLKFLEQHHYWTKSAIALRDEVKRRNYQLTLELLGMTQKPI